MAVPISPNADDPIHATTRAPRSASRGPRSIPPGLSSLSLPSSGLWMTPAAIPCAWLTMSPANETPGTTIRNSARTTTRLAASRGRIRMQSHSYTGAKIAYSTGIPIKPVAYGERAMTMATPSSRTTRAARW